jgi:hypothetical protein
LNYKWGDGKDKHGEKATLKRFIIHLMNESSTPI